MQAVFSKPRLRGVGPSFEPDFLWVTRSSGLITPILVEIEEPSKRWFRKDGRPTAHFTEAHDQLTDWAAWFRREGNSFAFRKQFLFEDQHLHRPLEPQFLLIYGRQYEFEHGGGHANPGGLQEKRDLQRKPNEAFRTFDSLRPRFDHRNSITLKMTAQGPKPYAFSPVFSTDSATGSDAVLLGDPGEALARSAMMSRERKRYIAERWEHWRTAELERRRRPTGGLTLYGGGEE